MGFFQRLVQGLSKTRSNFTSKVDQLVEHTQVIDDDFYEELTDILILADVGVRASDEIVSALRDRVTAQRIKDAQEARKVFKDLIVEQMKVSRPPLQWPMVMMVVGVNGVGKTTTVGKLALRFREINRSVMLAAADTFRAAADEQLKVWAQRADVPMISQSMGSDPAAVVYDAVQAAKARKTDLLIVDTAGRLHNKKNLMDELGKMRRIIGKEYPRPVRGMLMLMPPRPNGLAQANVQGGSRDQRHRADQADGTAKGGIAIAIQREFRSPCGISV